MFYFKFFLRKLDHTKQISFGLILNYKMENDNEKNQLLAIIIRASLRNWLFR